VIEVHELSKHYGALRALDQVSFVAQRGMVVAIVGPNGAGKTTLFRLLSTLIQPTLGTACIQGHDIRRESQTVRQLIGVAFTDTALYARLTVQETLRYFGRLYQMPSRTLEARIVELLRLFHMQSYAHQLVDTLSRGMRQKVVMARAILHSPDVLFLDEPTTGLDIQASADMIDFIRAYAQNRTILFATHSLTEIQLLCDTAIVLHEGRISGTPIPVCDLTTTELQAAIFERIGVQYAPREALPAIGK
jgi:sodium transport system ATP-binding protein